MYKNSIKKITIFIIIVGILVSSIGIVISYDLIATFEDTTQNALLEETNNYKKRLHSQIKTEFQMLNTISSIIGNSGLSKSDNFGDILHKSYVENDFLTVAFFNKSGNGILSKADDIIL